MNTHLNLTNNKCLALFLGCVILFLQACSSDSDDNTVTIADKEIALPMPQSISATAIDTNNLQVEVLVTPSSGATQSYILNDLKITSSEVKGTLEQGFAPGKYAISLIYSYEDPEFSHDKDTENIKYVELLDIGEAEVEVSIGDTATADFSSFQPNFADTDEDGHTNIIEVDNNNRTNPFDTLAFPGNPLPTPAQPKVKVIYLNGSAEFRTSWSETTGITHYGMHMAPTPGIDLDRNKMLHDGIFYNEDVINNGFGHSIGFGEPWYFVVVSQEVDAADEINVLAESVNSALMYVRTREMDTTAPQNIAVQAGLGENTISWTAPETGGAPYTLYFSTTPGVTSETGTFLAEITTTSKTHSGLINGVTYYYAVTANIGFGEGSISSEVGATPYGQLEAPTLSVSAEQVDNIQLEWTDIPGSASYTVFMAAESGITKENTAAGGTLQSAMQHGNIEEPTFSHPTKLASNTRYYFRVAAVDKLGRESPLSNEVNGTPHAATVPIIEF